METDCVVENQIINIEFLQGSKSLSPKLLPLDGKLKYYKEAPIYFSIFFS